MNFIEAWKKANGKRITRKKGVTYCLNTKENKIHETAKIYLDNVDLLADDWEIVKETKVIWTVTWKENTGYYNACVFMDRPSMEEWKELHKSRIQVIGTEKYINEI